MARSQDADEYRVDEFDMPNPDQKLKDTMDMINRVIDAGRGEKLARAMRRDGRDGAADVVEGIMDTEKNSLLKSTLDVAKMANSGDAAGALKIMDEGRANGVLTARQVLCLKILIHDDVDDPEGGLEYTVRLDEMDGKISHVRRAGALYRLGRINELEELCETWEGSRQDRDDLYLCRARILRARGKPDLAWRRALAMLTLDPLNWYAMELLGDILADAGDLRGAVLHYNKALNKDYNEVQFHVKKAEALMRMGRPDSAALACRRGLKVRPANKMLLGILKEAGGSAEPRRGGA